MVQELTVLANQADHSQEAIDVKSSAVDGVSTIVNGACRLRTITQTSAATAGTVIWADDTGVLFTTFSAVQGTTSIKFPFPGKKFSGHLRVTLANVTGLTISYH